MFETSLTLYLLLGVVAVATGQQTFHRKGNLYDAKVQIHRFRTQNSDDLVNKPHQQKFYPQRHLYGGRPWRQGDRITKEEIVQNLARTLLSRKKTSEEIQDERRKDNQEKLHEYMMYQILMAKKPTKPTSPPYHPKPVAAGKPSPSHMEPTPYRVLPDKVPLPYKAPPLYRVLPNKAPLSYKAPPPYRVLLNKAPLPYKPPPPYRARKPYLNNMPN